MPYFNRLLSALSEVAQSDLKRQLEFLKVENTVLRQKLGRHIRPLGCRPPKTS